MPDGPASERSRTPAESRKRQTPLDQAWKLSSPIRVRTQPTRSLDTVDHRQMRELPGRRVQDGVIVRLIAKRLKAGVWEKD